MEIGLYIRNKTNQHLRPLLIKTECEVCKETENLELHHIQPFAQLLEKCLKNLEYEYFKDSKEYTNTELENITNWMLGVQLKINYLTVCRVCHIDIHNKDGGFYNTTNKFNNYISASRTKKELTEEKNIKDVVIPYLDSVVGKKLYKCEQDELISIINIKINGRQQRSYSKLNEKLNVMNLPYSILPKKSNSMRYWVVTHI